MFVMTLREAWDTQIENLKTGLVNNDHYGEIVWQHVNDELMLGVKSTLDIPQYCVDSEHVLGFVSGKLKELHEEDQSGNTISFNFTLVLLFYTLIVPKLF